MTGYADTEVLAEFVGPSAILRKPFTAVELAAAVQASLSFNGPLTNVISLTSKKK